MSASDLGSFSLFEYDVGYTGPPQTDRLRRILRPAILRATSGGASKSVTERYVGSLTCLTLEEGQFNDDGTEDKFMLIPRNEKPEYNTERFSQATASFQQFDSANVAIFSGSPGSDAETPVRGRLLTQQQVVLESNARDRRAGLKRGRVTYRPMEGANGVSRIFTNATTNWQNSELPPGSAPPGFEVGEDTAWLLESYGHSSFPSLDTRRTSKFAAVAVQPIEQVYQPH